MESINSTIEDQQKHELKRIQCLISKKYEDKRKISNACFLYIIFKFFT